MNSQRLRGRPVPSTLSACGFVLIACVVGALSPWGLARGQGTPSRAPSPISVGKYVDEFQSSYRGVRSLRADFTQTYQGGGRTRVESGIVYFARGGRMRWEYQSPEQKLFLSDGKILVLYIAEEKQLTRSPVKSSEDVRAPFRLLLSRLNLRKVFGQIKLDENALPVQPGDRILRAVPKKNVEADFTDVLIELSDTFDIRHLVIQNPDRSEMEFTFDHIARNIPVSPSLFRFTPPPGTEIIDQR